MPMPDMVPVDSTAVAKVGYDPKRRELYVQFMGGSTYVYSDVPPETHRELLAAGSTGSYLNREIKPRYGYRHV